jgi:hypothetical protein
MFFGNDRLDFVAAALQEAQESGARGVRSVG